MENITTFIDEKDNSEFVIIDHGDETYTSMPKSVYDAQVEHLTEIIPADEA